MSTCSLSGNTLKSSSDIILNPSYEYGTGIHIKGVTGPTYYISSNNDLVIESGGTISFSNSSGSFLSISEDSNYNVNISTIANHNNSPNLTIDAIGSLYLKSNGGTVYIQNNLSANDISANSGKIGGSSIVTQNTLSNNSINFINISGNISANDISANSGKIGNSSIVTQNTLSNNSINFINISGNISANDISANSGRIGNSSIVTQNTLSNNYNINTNFYTRQSFSEQTRINLPEFGTYLISITRSPSLYDKGTSFFFAIWLPSGIALANENSGNSRGFDGIFNNSIIVTTNLGGIVAQADEYFSDGVILNSKHHACNNSLRAIYISTKNSKY
jgi:hypothetical protein